MISERKWREIHDFGEKMEKERAENMEKKNITFSPTKEEPQEPITTSCVEQNARDVDTK